MGLTDVATLADLCLAKGISKIKLADGTEIHFRDKVEENETIPAPMPEMPSSSERMPSDDEMLLMSTPFFDEIREERKQAIIPPSQEK